MNFELLCCILLFLDSCGDFNSGGYRKLPPSKKKPQSQKKTKRKEKKQSGESVVFLTNQSPLLRCFHLTLWWLRISVYCSLFLVKLVGWLLATCYVFECLFLYVVLVGFFSFSFCFNPYCSYFFLLNIEYIYQLNEVMKTLVFKKYWGLPS